MNESTVFIMNPGQNACVQNAGQECAGGQTTSWFWGRVDEMTVSEKNFY